jgi:hypothetical protein
MSNFPIGPTLAAIVVPIVLGYLFRTPSSAARQAEGKQWLEYGAVLKGFALGAAGLVALLIGIFFVVDAKDKLAVASMVALFGTLSVSLLLEFYGVRIGFDDTRVYTRSGWRKPRSIAWTDITACTYSPTNRWWVLETKDQGRVRIHEFLSGRASFFAALQARTGIRADMNPARSHAP